jgi:hypothetical protein
VLFEAFKREAHSGTLSHAVDGSLVTGEAYTAAKEPAN